MAENIKVKIEVDATSIKTATADSKQLEAALLKAGVPVEFMNDALDEVDKTLKEASVDAGKFAKALDSSATSTKSLRTQLAEAKNEAVKMSQQFGAFSKEAQTAAKRAAVIKDEIDDLNDTLNALNPEAKLNAFVKLGQGIQGGFQAATGALQLFGVENERITKLAQQFQGVLNLTQGINSVLQLKDVYGQLRLVLGLTTAAQTGLNTATVAGATATRGLTAAIASNPLGALAVALTVVVGALLLYTEATDDAAESTERLNKAAQDRVNALGEEINDKYKIFIRELKQLKDLRQAEGASVIEILRIEKQIADVRVQGIKEFIGAFGESAELRDKLDEALNQQAIAAAKLRTELSALPKRFTESFNSAETKKDLQDAAQQLRKIIQDELDKIEPIPTKQLNTGFEEYLKQLNLQIKDLNNQILFSTLDTFDNLLDSQAQGRIQQLEDEKKAGLITEEKYAKEVSKIKRKQALQDRAFAIFEIVINTAQAITKILATTPPIGVPPLIAAYTALAAAQTAAILSAPLPKFKTGTLNVGGGNLDADGGMAAIIHRGEAIIPADRNKDYHPTIAALYSRKIKASDINSYVEMKLKGKIPENINARISPRDLRNLKPIDTVNIRNTGILARQIGQEIAHSINLRRQ
jgi:hypothetical protein